MVESGKRLVQGRDLIPHINVLACTRDVRDGKGKSEASPSPSSPSRRVATRDSGTFWSTFYPRRRQGPRLPDRTVERRRARATCPAGRSSKPSPGHRIASARRRCAASPRRQPLDLYLLRKQVFNGFLARRTGSLTVGRVSGQSKTWPASRDLLGCSALQPCRLPAPNKRAISFGHVSRQACVKDAAPSFCTCF